MAINYHIQPFTAADIEKYHKGLLSAKEMHDLEKAALDDPFLADALEGYAVEGVNAIDDIAALKQKLNERTERKTVVVPITPANRSSNLWLKIAAIIVLVAGGGLLVYQLGFNDKKENNVAQASTPAESKSESAIPATTDKKSDTITGIGETATQNLFAAPEQQESKSLSKNTATEEKTVEYNGNAIARRKDTIITSIGAFSNPIASLSVKADDIELKKLPDSDGDGVSDNVDKALAGRVAGVNVAKSNKEDTIKSKEFTARSNQANGNVEDLLKKMPGMVVSPGFTAQQQARRNTFRGTITDLQNNPLPFANITNTADNVGTYADVKGNFVLTSPDSVLNVQVRSIGFTNNNYALRYDPQPNRIVMNEDRSLAEVIISRNRIPDSMRSRSNSLVMEEPEPVDGWNNYDTYLANNLNVPETYRSNRPVAGGKVEVSFEVDGQGEPINIRVEKSLCDACDKEAIRLIKDGPKFKRKAKKNGRTTVSISF